MRTWISIALCAGYMGLAGCTDGGGSAVDCDACDTAAEDAADADAVSVAPTAVAWTVAVAEDAPLGVVLAAQDVVAYLERMGLEVSGPVSEVELACRGDRGVVALVGDGLGEGLAEAGGTDQTWRIEEAGCGGGALVVLAGGGLLGRQYAAYEWLHLRGVRFFHPEDEFVPAAPRWEGFPTVRTHTPAFRWRSVSLHLTHPLELGDIFRLGVAEYAQEGVRYIDWQVKNGASFGTGGVPAQGFERRGIERGFLRTGGFGLYGVQQGSKPLVDPDDPTPVAEQIAEAIHAQMDVPEPPQYFGVSFNESEFSVGPEEEIVEQLTLIADIFAAEYPDVILMTTNHGTHQEPGPVYGVRPFDLPKFAPPHLGVSVHTLMFYDLERPAPVYGNQNFHFLYDFMEETYEERRLWYFPESAWWLTFDNAVPWYLPLTVEARDRDIQRLAFMLDGKLDGHRVFGSGHEWGYWQNEYCSLRMAADLDYRWTDCMADIAWPMGEAAAEVTGVLSDLVAHQETVFFDAELLAYLVGSDSETEVAAAAGIVFHPLPPTPAQVLAWDDAALAAWDDELRPRLEEMDAAYSALLARLDAVRADVPDAGRGYFDEIYDGIEVTGLRARHAWQLYGALAELRRAQGSGASAAAAEALLGNAFATTEDAIAVVHRREGGYRYAPVERATAGGPNGDEDDNWTIYGFRVHSRAHEGFYYKRADAQALAAFAGAATELSVDDALVEATDAVRVTGGSELGALTVDWSDGAQSEGSPPLEHTYAGPGLFTVEVNGGSAPLALPVAALAQEHHTGFSGVIAEPAGAKLIEGLLPALVFGAAGGSDLALGFAVDGTGRVAPDRWIPLQSAGAGATFQSAPATLAVPVVNVASAELIGAVTVLSGVATVPDGSDTLTLTGDLDTDSVIATVVSVGGFDEDGARAIVASFLGTTPDALPAAVPFVVTWTVEPDAND